MAFISTAIFFFQAEDGIRDIGVTGVQTCALPISQLTGTYAELIGQVNVASLPAPTIDNTLQPLALPDLVLNPSALQTAKMSAGGASKTTTSQIGRASCREKG